MEILSAASAKELRGIQQRNMPHECRVFEVSDVDTGGGRVATQRKQPPRYEGPCRLAPLGENNREHNLRGAIDAQSHYRLILPAGTVVDHADEIDVTGFNRTDAGNIAFSMIVDVVSIDPPNVAIELTRRLIVRARS